MLDGRNESAKRMEFLGALAVPLALIRIMAAAAVTLPDAVMCLLAGVAARRFEREIARGHDTTDWLMVICFGGNAVLLGGGIVFAVMWV